jgi:DNA-directed RNA polymerase subunit RPC12/RpoP
MFRYQCPECKTEIKSKVEDLNVICGECGVNFEEVKKKE